VPQRRLINLDGVLMYVSSSAAQGVVGIATRLRFLQKGARVFARYGGGAVQRGCLIGTVAGTNLVFPYVQREASGELHAGRSVCHLHRRDDGRLRILEHFQWTTREGAGTNVFDEVPS
jgi:hypothetical protein